MPPFPPGQSGNPRGRPKGARGVAHRFLTEVDKPAEDMPEEMSKLQALIRTQVDKAVKGDNRAVQAVLERIEALDAKLDAASGRGFVFTSADREVIAEIWRRLSPEP